MTLAEKLAREAAPCMYDDPDVGSRSCDEIGACGGNFGPCEKCACRPAIIAAIEKAIRVCAEQAETGTLPDVRLRLRALLTDDVEDGG